MNRMLNRCQLKVINRSNARPGWFQRSMVLFFGLFGMLIFAAAQPYIATSQNFYCAGSEDEVTLYCNVLAFDPSTDVSQWTFEWSPVSEVSDPSSQSVSVSPSATTTFSAVMTAPDGTVYLDDITITVYPAFTVDAGPDLDECSTIGVALNATVDVSNAMLWEWSPAAGLSNASIPNPQILVETTELYTVTATIAGLGGASCSASDQIQVTSIFPSLDLGPDIVACTGEVVTIDPELPVNYQFDWSVGGASLPILEVTSTATIGLTATSPEGCVESDVIQVTFSDGPEFSLPDSAFGCVSDGILLDATPINAASGPFSYVWSNGSNQSVTTLFETGMVNVSVSDAGGCSTQASVWVDALMSPEFQLAADTSLCFEDFPGVQYQLGVPAGFASYQWLDGQSSHAITIDEPGLYGVTVLNDIGCSTQRFTEVIDFCSVPLLFIPSAFTPDGDGLNEVLKIEGRNLVQLEFKLYNRWGALVWTADEIGDYWHGQGPAATHYVQDDLYIWKAKYRHFTDANGKLSPWSEASGSVRILR